MAHEIYTLENGKKSMAYVGKTPWHGMGQQLTQGAPIAKWIEEAGLAWEIVKAPALFAGPDETIHQIPGKNVLYRSDNMQAMSVVSDRYKVVQPAEVLDFFAEFVAAGDMTLETAGSICGGSKIWALARIGEGFKVDAKGRDLVDPFVLLATSCDKSLTTQATRTDVRVVCNNTLEAAVNNAGSSAIKVPHSRHFDASKVKAEMGLVRESINANIAKIRKMHKLSVTDQQAMAFFIELLKTPEEKKTGKVELETKRRAIPKIWESYKAAPGAEDTVWGMVNAITHSVDHNPHAQSDDTRLNSAWFGAGAVQKREAFSLASDKSFLDSIAEKTKGQQGVDRILDLVAV